MAMEDVITDVARIIHNRIEWNSYPDSHGFKKKLLDDNEAISQFNATYNILLRLQKSKPNNNNNWYQLFCRRLGRLMDNHLLLTKDICTELYDDISYILKEPSVRHDNLNWTRFLARMTFEAKLEQRELQVRHSIGRLKKLNELYSEYGDFLLAYIQKCISLHSKVQVRELIENVDQLFSRTCDQKVTSLTPQTREHLRTKLKCIEINFDCSGRLLHTLVSPTANFDQSSNAADYSYRNFLPSVNQLQFEEDANVQSIESALLSQRWFVILGDPGSAKTTTLRWIIRIFAEAVLHGEERVLFKGRDLGPTRVPILIRIGEFAEWYNLNPASSLIDYIGKHTWFRESYIGEEHAKMLKELIVNGHVLTLLDGLDEIPEVGQRKEIVDLVRTFIDEYVRAPNFISAFDTGPFDDSISLGIQSPNRFGGNQVIITSRVVGYHLYPLNGRFIEHSLLLSMKKEESNQFVTEWIEQIESSINEILVKEDIPLNRDLRTSIKKQYDTLNMLICNSAKSLISNPLILSVICMSMFNLSVEFLHKCRIQVYDYAVQSSLRTWDSQESNISKSALTNVLIDLATYLHLQSPSGLIDEFDIRHLCYCTLKQQGLLHNSTELREYAKELTSLLDHQVSIIAERGLQVFGFLHLSFQEYFVARSLVKYSSIDKIAENILAFTINSRFREPLLLAIGWVSWKYSSDDYEKCCDILVTQNENFVYPFGALLLFDAFDDIQTLPSNSILFAALNSLLDHPFKRISIGYFSQNFSKLDEDAQIQWMQFHLTNEKRVMHFCHCLLYEVKRHHEDTKSIVSKLISPTITHHLWTFRNESTSVEHIIDQTLQNIMQSNVSFDSIFENELSAQYPSLYNWKFDIHPLVLSVIIAVCGGFRVIYENNARKLEFSPKNIHNKSLILVPINEYFLNTKELHGVKIQRLIDRYENILRKSIPTDTSADIVDTFVALICLRSLTDLSIYEEFSTHHAFSLAIHRFKRISLYLIRLYNAAFNDRASNELITSEVETIIEVFFSHSTQHNEQLMEFSLSCAAALQSIQIDHWPNLSNFDIYRNRGVDRYLDLQPEFYYYRKRENEENYNQILINIQRLQMLKDAPLFLLTFVPQPLQGLYKLLIIEPVDKTESLPLIVLLSESLMLIESIGNANLIFYCTLSILQPLFKRHNLEIYASVLFWEDNFSSAYRENLSNLYPWCTSKMHVSLILLEWYRLNLAERSSYDQDLQLFAAAISLARVFQARHGSQINKTFKNNIPLNLSTEENKIIYSAIEKINDPVLQMLALSTILVSKEPFVFDEEQRNGLKSNTFSPLKDLPEFLPLLIATLLFVRCHPVRQFFPKHYQQILDSIIKQLKSELIDQQSKEAAYIALRTLNNPDLSQSLSGFEKRTMNLSDLCQFNSMIFFRYFTDTTSFGASNVNLLSSIYLAELSVNVQILKTCTYKNRDRKMSPFTLTELYQLLHDSSMSKKIMSFEAAIWIEKNLQMANKNEIARIIKWISTFYVVEREALSVLEKWLQYRTDESRKFFARYAALHLAKDGRNSSHLIEIIQEIFDCKKQFTFERTIQDLLELEVDDVTNTREIFLIVIQGAYRLSLKTTATVRCNEILDLILELEFQRIESSMHKKKKDSVRSYLSVIDSCSSSAQVHLAEHLCIFINGVSAPADPVRSYYLASTLHWMISSLVYNDITQLYPSEVFKCIYRFLHDTKLPQVQKTIVNGFNKLFFAGNLPKEHVFMKSDVMIHLEQLIHSYATTEYAQGDDLLAASLLAYGNGLLRLQKVQINYIVSEETSCLLKTLSQRSSSKLIAVRADLCHIFSQTPNAMRSTIFSSIKELEITPENTYNMLLQQTLYQFIDHDLCEEVKIIIEHLKTCSTDVIDKFILELYNYLEKIDSTNYLSDHTPNYLNVTIHFINENFDIFLRALQKSTFGEENFKRTIYNAYQRTYNEMLIVLYGSFGVITTDFVDMLAHEKDSWNYVIWECLKKIKQISDRDAVEHLFSILEATFHSDILTLIIQLAKLDAISLLEVHQRVSAILRNISNKNDETCLTFERQILRNLMNLSCIRQDNLSESEIESYIPEQIYMDSTEEYSYPDSSPPLFLRRNFFMASVSFLMNCGTTENNPNSTHLSDE